MYIDFMNLRQELKKGSIQTLILAVLRDRPCHGYAIAREIERRSGSVLSFGEGALYPALRALEREGLAAGSWEVQESGPARRVYSLTDEGRKILEANLKGWSEFTSAVDSVLQGGGHAQPI